MAVNLDAHIRMRIIDKCLRDREHIYTWKELAEACALALEEETGKSHQPSRRTIMSDIQRMRSGVMGYEAPIAFDKKEGYYYTHAKFSIQQNPLQKKYIEEIHHGIAIVRQLLNHSSIEHLLSALLAIEENLNLRVAANVEPLLFFETNPNERGQKFLDPLYRVIKNKKCINIRYQAFTQPEEVIQLSPYFLKEFNNRWYVIGYAHEQESIYNLALDRINDFYIALAPFVENTTIHPENLYKHVYGITNVLHQPVEHIEFSVTKLLSHYLETNPLHESQRKCNVQGNKILYSLDVKINYEIKSKLLSFGSALEILSPLSFREEMIAEIQKILSLYRVQ
jgi:predicted DNA-binding transcriptional regulator YafY